MPCAPRVSVVEAHAVEQGETGVSSSSKTRVPTDDVYLPTLQPTRRLVTCGGAFDPASGHYADNVVVFASLAG